MNSVKADNQQLSHLLADMPLFLQRIDPLYQLAQF